MKVELIFVPTPITGHLVSTLEFVKHLVDLNDHIRITILNMKLPPLGDAGRYVRALAASNHSIQIIDLPASEDAPPMEMLKVSPEAYFLSFVEKSKPHVKKTVAEILSSRSLESVKVMGLVVDFFCGPLIDVASELNLPSYTFLTSGACFLALLHYLPKQHIESPSVLDEKSNDELLIPGFVNSVPPKVLPLALFNNIGYDAYIKITQGFLNTTGIMVNTFAGLEPSVVNYFLQGQEYPPVYTVGPLLSLNIYHPNLDLTQRDEIMKWLDDQPQSSMVFLCFGSLGKFTPPQTKEVALGLEQSGYRFLWSLQADPANNGGIDTLLPEGFLDRIKGRGMICGWAPQLEVLGHKAVGGFVSHCGWNSILESLWHGVPIVAWPLYAEQKLNAFTLVKELGLAVELKVDDVGGSELVVAGEFERAVRCLMESDNVVRKKAKEVQQLARQALVDGGPSDVATKRFINDIGGGIFQAS